MSTRRKSDLWEALFYLGVLILAIMFLYQLLKLWNAGVSAVSGLPSTIGQALSNTAASVENAIASAVTGPFSFLSFIPAFLSLVFSFLGAILDPFGILSGIASFFGGTAAPILQGSGSSTTTAANTAPDATPGPGNGAIGGIALLNDPAGDLGGYLFPSFLPAADYVGGGGSTSSSYSSSFTAPQDQLPQ